MAVNLPFVPPVAVILLVSNPVMSSVNVNVKVTSPFAAVAASFVMVTVGVIVSGVSKEELLATVPVERAIARLPATSWMELVELPSKGGT